MKGKITGQLKGCLVLPLPPLLQLLECLSEYMCGDDVLMNFPPDFHNYTGLNWLVNSLP